MAVQQAGALRYRLLALDMDGTILNNSGEISERTRRVLREAMRRGMTVMFATGRGIVRVRTFIEQLGNRQAPIITANGGEIWKNPSQPYRYQTLHPQTVIDLSRFAKEHRIHFWAYARDMLLKEHEWVPDEQIPLHAWLKFGMRTRNMEESERIRKILHAAYQDLEITVSHPLQIEVNPRGVSKGQALQDVCELLGIELAETVAIGDGENDVSMLKLAGLAVAMGNASESVKRFADVVTFTNEEDGVAQFVAERLLDQGS